MTDPVASLDELVERARAALAGVQGPADPGPFVGTSADGMIRCTVGSDGRVSSIEADPRVMRLGVEELCAQLAVGVNAALSARPGRPDTAPLLADLQAMQEQSVTQMREITRGFTDALHSRYGSPE